MNIQSNDLDNLGKTLTKAEEANTPRLVVRAFHDVPKIKKVMAMVTLICKPESIRILNPDAEDVARQLVNHRRRMKVAGLITENELSWPEGPFQFPEKLEPIQTPRNLSEVASKNADQHLMAKLSDLDFVAPHHPAYRVVSLVNAKRGKWKTLYWLASSELRSEIPVEDLVTIEVSFHKNAHDPEVTYRVMRPRLVRGSEILRKEEVLATGKGMPLLTYVPRYVATVLGEYIRFPYIERLQASGRLVKSIVTKFARLGVNHSSKEVGFAIEQILEDNPKAKGPLVERLNVVRERIMSAPPKKGKAVSEFFSNSQIAYCLQERFRQAVVTLQEQMAVTDDVNRAVELWLTLAHRGQPEVAELEPAYQPWIRACAGTNPWNENFHGLTRYTSNFTIPVEQTDVVSLEEALPPSEPAVVTTTEEEVEIAQIPLSAWHPDYQEEDDEGIPEYQETLASWDTSAASAAAAESEDTVVSEGLADVPEFIR